ncbi:uncharacterized protein LOC126676807 isoform X2 [Mercurialis annua]|uniref:uncharacterized protein LOC126676807 isoform X2 n=1 Tax=Mercurialis annua TaxID=3986 RepID=UPI002160B5C4|nr:uncharacterized protein LOC126676807 isoform X2 [Mercurialis annua]
MQEFRIAISCSILVRIEQFLRSRNGDGDLYTSIPENQDASMDFESDMFGLVGFDYYFDIMIWIANSVYYVVMWSSFHPLFWKSQL